MKSLPTILTIIRMALGPIVAGLILWANDATYSDPLLAGFIYALALVIFAIAASTDWLDGWLARKLDAVTPLGAALDHISDKVLVACVLIALAYAALPLWLVVAAIVILGRDIAIAGLREGISAQGGALPVSELGKWKAAAEMAGICAFLAFASAARLNASVNIVQGLEWASYILLWSAALLALVSAAQYAASALRKSTETETTPAA